MTVRFTFNPAFRRRSMPSNEKQEGRLSEMEITCASVFSGHRLPATSSMMVSHSFEPEFPMARWIGPSENPTAGLTKRTEHFARCATSSDTFRDIERSVAKVSEAITSRSGRHQLLALKMASDGDPDKDSGKISHCGNRDRIHLKASSPRSLEDDKGSAVCSKNTFAVAGNPARQRSSIAAS